MQTERLAGAKMLVIADLTGRAGAQRILAAAEISRAEIEEELPNAIIREDQSFFDPASRQVRGRRVTRLGAIIFEESPLPRPTGPAAQNALAEGVRLLGIGALPFSQGGGTIARTDRLPAPDDRRAMAGCRRRSLAGCAGRLVPAVSDRYQGD